LKILRWIEGVVAEAQASSDQGIGTAADADQEQGQAQHLGRLERSMLLIWIQVFESSSGVWPFFNTIGTALRLYSEAKA
jgi:hypothetical protein